MKETWHQSELKKYFAAFMWLLVFMVVSILYFFYCVQVKVMAAAENTIVEHVRRQSGHFQRVMEVQYEYLEGMAGYLGRSEELLSRENLEALRAACGENSFARMAIIDEDGLCTYEDGRQNDVSAREYFREAMAGKRALSNPIESKADGKQRVILGVPIVSGERVIGVLGGSFDVGRLGRFLFGDIYDGDGLSLIVAPDGTVVSGEGEEEEVLHYGENFLEYYAGTRRLKGASFAEVKSDFEGRKGGFGEFEGELGARYLVYQPLDRNGWMLCYVVPSSKVREEYGFIRYYEVILSVVLLSGVAGLLVYIWNVNLRTHHKLIQYAQTDVLTGAMNKDSTEAEINRWLADEECKGIQAFLMMDVDRFKTVNDVYGHAAGDDVLHQIGQALSQEFRENDIIGRIGGDEFVVLMKNVMDESRALARVEALCRRLRQISVNGAEEKFLSGSIGVAYSPRHGSSYKELYLCADRALYETKEKGRDGYTVYTG